MASKLTPWQDSLLYRSAARPFRITHSITGGAQTSRSRNGVSAKPGSQSAWSALDRRAREVVLRRTAPQLVSKRVFAREHERAAKLRAVWNAVDREQVELSPGSRATMGREIARHDVSPANPAGLDPA